MLTLILLVAIFLVAIYRKRQEFLPKEAFNRMPTHLLYYAYAQCRMGCIGVTETDIKTLMQTGIINMNRSRRALQPCPVFAVQARVRNGYLRVLFEQCHNTTYVMNCYNLGQDTTCNCSADYQPKQN